MLNIDILKTELQIQYPIASEGEWSKLDGGYECEVWRVGEWVVRICPDWRNVEALKHIYRHVCLLAKEFPEIVAPIKTAQGDDLLHYENRPIAVFPYISGKPLNRNNDTLLRHSAELLAQIHMASFHISENAIKLLTPVSDPNLKPIETDPNFIQDPQLDDWYNNFMGRSDLPMGLMHGDYYRANILCDGDKILGVIDWDECNYGVLTRELAWATWEHCRTESGDNLDIGKTLLFLRAYHHKNRVLNTDYDAIVPLIRYHLRYEIRRSLSMEQAGMEWDEDYRQQEIRGFDNLRHLSLPNL